MIALKRPEKPQGFPPLELRQAQARWEQQHSAWLQAGCPEKKGEHIHEPPALWTGYLPQFLRAQHTKCGFCESSLHSQVPPVDHFAPKGGVDHPDPSSLGQEVHGGNNVRGRKTLPVYPYGYFKRAYDWNNWLVICERCNTGWKRAFFRVAEDPHPDPATEAPFTPLLLNPFDDPPEEHLEFRALGEIVPRDKSRRGQVTIQLVGLDRESLRAQREKAARDAFRLCERARKALDLGEDSAWKEVLEDLLPKLQPETQFAGVYRSMVWTVLGVCWDELEHL